ncbi:hypothetical protein TNIN_146031 [Trichonephila inaurata madagascariensis]|uniref:Uncharacterized protein n=1 Tax=Trichonephila inaurata madagascariensis TaxID=2747483 RepID=A0A8X6Y0N7_9ARAC|nr:hypothetical protein TNIN_146031 [Trichonephila inaurata madagascariensis]
MKDYYQHQLLKTPLENIRDLSFPASPQASRPGTPQDFATKRIFLYLPQGTAPDLERRKTRPVKDDLHSPRKSTNSLLSSILLTLRSTVSRLME